VCNLHRQTGAFDSQGLSFAVIATALRCALWQKQNNQRFCFHTHRLSYSAPLYSNKADKWRGIDTRFVDGVRGEEHSRVDLV
jgi:hypothetical protein